MRSLSDSLQLEYLESLHVCNTTVHESDLAKLVKMHAETLQRISLTNIVLLTGTWLVLLNTFKSVKYLQTLRLAHIEGVGSPVQSRQRDKERRKLTLDVSRNERAMTEMLDEVIGTCLAIPVSMFA